MSVKKDYAKAYANYLRRVARQVAKGYQVTPIERTKKPTAASVKRIQSQKAKQIVHRAVRENEANKQLSKKLKPGKKTKRKARPLTAKQRSDRTKKGWSDERRQKQSELMKQKWKGKNSGGELERLSGDPGKTNPPEKTHEPLTNEDYDEIMNSIEALWQKLQDKVETIGFDFDNALTKKPFKKVNDMDDKLQKAIDEEWSKESIDEIATNLEQQLTSLCTDARLGWKLLYADVLSDYSDDEIRQYLIKGKR